MLNLLCILVCFSGHAQAAPAPITLGAEEGYPPFSFAKDEKAAGTTIEKIRYIFDGSKSYQLQFFAMPFVRCMQEVKEHRLDGCLHSPDRSVDEKAYFFHHVPLVEDDVVVIAPMNSKLKIQSAADLEKTQVGVVRGYIYQHSFESNKRIEKVITPNDESLIRMIAAGRIPSGLAIPRVTAEILKKEPQLKAKVKIVGELEKFKMYVALQKAKKAELQGFANALDEGLKKLKQSPRYREWQRLENDYVFDLKRN